MSENKRISYKSKYLKSEKKLAVKDKELEKLRQEFSSLEGSMEELKKQTDTADKEVEQYLDHLKRLKAEFENYKKRMAKERQQLLCWAAEDLIKELLPILDDLERAISAANSSQDFSSLIQGIQMVYNYFKQLLKKKGLEEIFAEGEDFDPHIHEAILRIESGEYPDNIVVQEMRKGYKFKNRVLRPTMVKVNKRGLTSQANSQDQNEGEKEEGDSKEKDLNGHS